MTSKLDTAGLVERLRCWSISGPLHRSFEVQNLCNEAANLIEALTQAAAPDMDGEIWLVERPLRDGGKHLYLPCLMGSDEANRYRECNPDETLVAFVRLPAASQLSAIQERAERAYNEGYAARDEVVRVCRERAEAAEARVAEITAERDLLQEIIDSRPAINAGLPETYIKWSQAIYSGEFVRAALAHKGEGR